MSQQQINRSADLKALLDDGYEVAVKSDHLVLYNVPYVNEKREVKRGALISVLEINAGEVIQPTDHKAYFSGEHPCDENGKKLKHFAHSSDHINLGESLTADHMFSCKPLDENGKKRDYANYHEKMTAYAESISPPASKLDPSATARTYIVVDSDEPDPIFHYVDSASTRSGIAAISNKLALGKVAIIGLGGSGSYVLDLIAKTPIREIHLFDADDFLQHNAFRSPGASSLQTLKKRLKKVDYFGDLYAPMRKGIVPYAVHIDGGNLHLLDGMDFVFICIDKGDAKEPIVNKLEADDISFTDVGMGIHVGDDKLGGVARVTTSTPGKRDHFRQRVSFAATDYDDLYGQNIQIADINALNATLAVIKWKKLFGFYADFDNEHSCNFTIDGNKLDNEDKTS